MPFTPFGINFTSEEEARRLEQQKTAMNPFGTAYQSSMNSIFNSGDMLSEYAKKEQLKQQEKQRIAEEKRKLDEYERQVDQGIFDNNTGVSQANQAVNNPNSPYMPGSPFGTAQWGDYIRTMDDYQKRQRDTLDYVVGKQKDVEGYRNTFTAAENALNRYLDQKRTGASILNTAIAQRF